MRAGAKRGFLLACKSIGLFRLARFATRRGLRILCYHGFSLSDESNFRPKLFMRPETFQIRMQFLERRKYPVMSLEQACEGLSKGSLPDDAVAITIDDGFFSVYRSAWPILRMKSFPATLYVTSYYVEKQNPIFRLVLQYMFWKTNRERLDCKDLGVPLSGVQPLRPEKAKEETLWEIIRFGESQMDEPERCKLAEELGQRLGVEYSTMSKNRGLTLMNAEEIRRAVEEGLDIQLHTHRHSLPDNSDLVQREILDNRRCLEPLAGKKLQHLCYPSGIWSQGHWAWLEKLGIVTATTCDPGLNYPETPLLGLRRFLDGQHISQIEFEAELSGFSEIVRSVRSFLRPS
ncbi:MAG TPA: polysaccharide deacetylase family protein [Candidatus Acidoferrum sp.]|nr:polysaccharide deacetylase family protein [Candidatus Acidoferrum sp.]